MNDDRNKGDISIEKSGDSNVRQPDPTPAELGISVDVSAFDVHTTHEETEMSTVHDAIAERAHEIWEGEGTFSQETPLHDWLQAEAALSMERHKRFID